MALFKHPTIRTGSLSVGHDSLPIVDGVVNLPINIGESQGWHRLDENEIEAHENRPRAKAASDVDEVENDDDE